MSHIRLPRKRYIYRRKPLQDIYFRYINEFLLNTNNYYPWGIKLSIGLHLSWINHVVTLCKYASRVRRRIGKCYYKTLLRCPVLRLQEVIWGIYGKTLVWQMEHQWDSPSWLSRGKWLIWLQHCIIARCSFQKHIGSIQVIINHFLIICQQTSIALSRSLYFLALSISSLHLYQATTKHFSIHTDTHTYIYICVHIQLRYWYVYITEIVTTRSRFARSPIKVTHGCMFS